MPKEGADVIMHATSHASPSTLGLEGYQSEALDELRQAMDVRQMSNKDWAQVQESNPILRCIRSKCLREPNLRPQKTQRVH